MLVADPDILVLITLCSSLLLLAGLVGLTGTLLNSHILLAIYSLLLWPAFISLLSIGYASYKRSAFSLDRKLNYAWSQWYTDTGRAVIQDSLRCCGFTDPAYEATIAPGVGGGCYPRSLRPGCKGPLLRFERANLEALWRAAFSTTPLHIVNIIISLVCSNHITRTFGTGITPRAYRLRIMDVKDDAKELLQHFAQGGAMREPPALARTGSGMGVYREDKEVCPLAYSNLQTHSTRRHISTAGVRSRR